MFLISSKVGDKYGVKDTSDDVEEFYTSKEIYDIIRNLEIPIRGVSLSDNKLSIEVYSPNKIAVKIKLLFDVEVTVEGYDIVLRKYNGSDTELAIPYEVVRLNDFCFVFCKNLKKVVLPNSVTSLGESCFMNCESLQEITIPSSVTSLGDRCFF